MGISHVCQFATLRSDSPQSSQTSGVLKRLPQGDVPLFPGEGRPRKKEDRENVAPAAEKPIRRDVAARRLLPGEKLAKLPKLTGLPSLPGACGPQSAST